MRINQKAEVVQDDSELGKDPFPHRERSRLITFDGDLDIPLAPDEESQGSQEEEDSDKDANDFFPFWAQVQILEKIEFIESNKEGKNGHVLL